jgi:transcription initiation factor TFIID subunit 3
MQVPLEEDDEMEEEEVINDENFLGKRPLDSPEVEEMPSMKRPRLLSTKGDSLDVVLLEAREPLSSINPQKTPPVLSPVRVQDRADLAPPSPQPPMLAPFAKSQLPIAKPLETKSFTPKTKTKASSPGQKTKSPKAALSPARLGSPIRSPKTIPKEKKSPGRSKSPKSPKSPKIVAHVPQTPVRPETPNRTPSAMVVEKTVKETIPVMKPTQTPPEVVKLNIEMQPKKPVVTDKTIDDSIDAVIARACAEREPDPFEFSSGSESEGDTFTSPKRISGSECATPKASTSSNNFTKSLATPLPLSSGTSSSDNSWTMDASIDEVVRKAKLGAPSNMPPTFPYISSPSISPPTPEPLHKGYEEKAKLPSSVDVKKKLKKELKTKLKKKEKQRDRERERERNKERSKEKDKMREREKEKEAGKELKYPWRELMKDEDSDPYKFKIKEFEDIDAAKVRLKDGIVRREREKHKDKKKDRERSKREKDKRERERLKEKNREDKIKAPPTQLVLPPKEMALPLFSPSAVRVPAMLPAFSPMLPEKLFEEKEKPKEKERKKDKKEKKKKKEKEKEKEKKEREREKERREREKREKEKEKHKHEKVSWVSFSQSEQGLSANRR